MIPNTFHLIWIDPTTQSGIGPLPSDVSDNLNSWHGKEAKHRPVLWELPSLYDLCSQYHMPEVAAALRVCRFPAMQADLGRLFLLKVFGGFWVDLKLHLLMPFLDSLAEYDLIVTEHFVAPNLPNPNGTLSNSFIGARPNHPAIARALEFALANINNRTSNCYWTAGAPNIKKAIDGANDLGRYRMLTHTESWGRLFKIQGGSYNADDRHWSLREKVEPLYFD